MPVLGAGLPPLNVSLATVPTFGATITTLLWWYLPSILKDTSLTTQISPINCSSSSCVSYFMPGPISYIAYDRTLPQLPNNFSDADVLVVNDAPGYQIEFVPVAADVQLSLSDCRVYGMPYGAIGICLQAQEDGLVGGNFFLFRI
jgi:hypothetical protein